MTRPDLIAPQITLHLTLLDSAESQLGGLTRTVQAGPVVLPRAGDQVDLAPDADPPAYGPAGVVPTAEIDDCTWTMDLTAVQVSLLVHDLEPGYAARLTTWLIGQGWTDRYTTSHE